MEVHSGGHYISHVIEKQVISVKLDLSPKVTFGIRQFVKYELNFNENILKFSMGGGGGGE